MEELEELIKRLKSERRPIIVEGKKDKEALEKLGVHNVHPLSGKPLFKFVESFKESGEIVLLLDFDREGRKLKRQLLQGFQLLGVRVDLSYEKVLRESRLSHIEGLPKRIERGGWYGENSAGCGEVHNPRFNKDRGCR